MNGKYIAIAVIWISVGIGAGWSADWATMFWGGLFASMSTCAILGVSFLG